MNSNSPGSDNRGWSGRRRTLWAAFCATVTGAVVLGVVDQGTASIALATAAGPLGMTAAAATRR